MEILISNGESHSTSQHVGPGVGFHSTKIFRFLRVSFTPSFAVHHRGIDLTLF